MRAAPTGNPGASSPSSAQSVPCARARLPVGVRALYGGARKSQMLPHPRPPPLPSSRAAVESAPPTPSNAAVEKTLPVIHSSPADACRFPRVHVFAPVEILQQQRLESRCHRGGAPLPTARATFNHHLADENDTRHPSRSTHGRRSPPPIPTNSTSQLETWQPAPAHRDTGSAPIEPDLCRRCPISITSLYGHGPEANKM